MKLILLLLILMPLKAFSISYFPVSFTPETVSSVKLGLNDMKPVAGVEISLHGEKEVKYLEEKVGFWGDYNHSFSLGIFSTHFADLVYYGAVHVHLEAWDRVGTGLKQVVFYDTGLPSGEKLKGELTYLVFYQFPEINLFWDDNREYLMIYTGFKSEHFDFMNESAEEVVEKAFHLTEISKNAVFGVYYNPDVAQALSFGFEMALFQENHVYMGSVYFSF